MNQLQAFRDTIAFIEKRDRMGTWEENSRGRPASIRPDHVRDMLRRIEEDPNSFSSSKRGRWLGWAQCAATACGVLSLDEAKMINRANEKDVDARINPRLIDQLLLDLGLDLCKVINCPGNMGRTASAALAEALSKRI